MINVRILWMLIIINLIPILYPVILGLGAWGDHAQCKTFSQYVEIVQRAQDENHGVGTLTHKQHAWTFEFLKALGESIDNVEETVEFSHYKVVRI